MICEQTQTHTIKPGDSLYQIAKMHQITVPELYALNPGINPYNLQVGEQIMVCQGSDYADHPIGSEGCPQLDKIMNLSNSMRLAWEQHVYWTRMLLISIASGLGDQSAVTARILRNPHDIATIFSNYYPADAANMIMQLLTEHLQIGADLITTLRDGNMRKAEELNRQWYANADQMAAAFSAINPAYDREELCSMLYAHLELTTREVVERIAQNYAADIAAFDQVEREALNMADYFTAGIMKQFPDEF